MKQTEKNKKWAHLVTAVCMAAILAAVGIGGISLFRTQGMAEATGNKEAAETREESRELHAAVTLLENKKNAYISWQKIPGAISYEIQRSESKDGKFLTYAAVDGASPGRYTDTDVSRGKNYYFRVTAVLENGTVSSAPIKFACALKKVTGIKSVESTHASVRLTWKESEDANYYKVYYSTNQSDFQYAGITKKNVFTVKNLKSDKAYYFRVKACAAKKASKLDGAVSDAVKIKTNNGVTVFAGDSIATGFSVYGTMDKTGISGTKHVVAAIGLNTMTFRTRRAFSGRTGLETVIAYNPGRLYIMLGLNEIHYRSSSDTAASFQAIIQEIKKACPTTDIVILAVSPVSGAELQRRSGFARIPDYNRKLEAIARSMGIKFLDYTGFLKDANGCLKPQYAAGDGIHWTVSAYDGFAQQIKNFEQSLR